MNILETINPHIAQTVLLKGIWFMCHLQILGQDDEYKQFWNFKYTLIALKTSHY
jgi:hypothetical protein